jgi:hypothetical protein
MKIAQKQLNFKNFTYPLLKNISTSVTHCPKTRNEEKKKSKLSNPKKNYPLSTK